MLRQCAFDPALPTHAGGFLKSCRVLVFPLLAGAFRSRGG